MTLAKRTIQILTVCCLASLCFLQAGCEMPPMPWDKKVEKPEAGKEEAAAEEAPAEEAAPLDMNKLLPPAMRTLPAEEVTIPMPDGLKIVGQLYDPTLKKNEDGETEVPASEVDEYTGPKYPLVILLHGLNQTHAHWQDLPATLVKAGYAVFSMDLRGHGQSTKARGRTINWRVLEDHEWPELADDVTKVRAYFAKDEDYPEVDAKQIALIGEKLGANVGIYTAKKDDAVQAMVLLSPGMNIKGLDAGQGLLDYSNSTLILVSEDERESYSAARHLYNWLVGPKALQIYKKAGDGADMLVNQTGIGDQIRDWLIQHFPPTGIAVKPTADSTDAAGTEAEKTASDGAKPDAKAEAAKTPATPNHSPKG